MKFILLEATVEWFMQHKYISFFILFYFFYKIKKENMSKSEKNSQDLFRKLKFGQPKNVQK